MKNDDFSENERNILHKHLPGKKNFEQANRRSEVDFGNDQTMSTSVNRYRVRNKIKPEIVGINGNSSESNKKDMYKVIFSKFHYGN